MKKLTAFFGRLLAALRGINREKLPLILGIAAAALLVLLAAVVPALFIPPRTNDAPLVPATPGERAALFGRFWREEEGLEIVRLDRTAFSEAELAASTARIEALHEAFLFDDALPASESSGENFYILRDADGTTLRMREFYEQSSGDWSNWFRVFTDIDEEEIYFFYQSCKCLQNPENYDFSDMNAWTLADGWRDVLGAENVVYLGAEGVMARAAYLMGEQALYYDVSYTSYTTPEYVVDFRFVLQPAPEN